MAVAAIAPAMLARVMRDPFAAVASPALRGYVPSYRGAATACPCCSRSNWLVGRTLAECAFCTTAVPIAPSERPS